MLVQFENVLQATMVLSLLHNVVMEEGGKELKIQFAKSQISK